MAARSRLPMNRTGIWAWPRWSVVEPRYTASQLLSGTGTFRLTQRDVAWMAMLLEHSFLGARHLELESSIAVVTRRLGRLHAQGLVATTPERLERGRATPLVYGLTQLGFDVLAMDGNPTALAVESDWKPPHQTKGSRNHLTHQLAVADLSTLIVRHAARFGIPVDWRGSKRLVQRVHPMAAGGQRLEISPDAALLFANGAAVIVEHERSLRSDGVHDRMTKYKRYFAGRMWQANYAREPKVLFSVDVAGNTQGYGESVYELAKAVADDMLLLPAMFTREEWWRAGKVVVEAVGKPAPVDILHAVGFRPRRRTDADAVGRG